MDERVSFPGPTALGRGLVVAPGGDVPAGAHEWPRLRIDDEALAAPDEAVATLDRAWRERQPTVVELAVPFASLKEPETCESPPYELDVGFGFARERLHFLVWANRYDGRAGGEPRWHHSTRAQRLGATAPADPRRGDVVLPDGTPVWIDGGPRTSSVLETAATPASAAVAPSTPASDMAPASTGPETPEPEPAAATGSASSPDAGGTAVVHVNQVWAGSLEPDRWCDPADSLAPDQLAAVRHAGGPARVLAPAGSGKTRVLTSRLRHLLVDRAWAPGTVMALAYNTRAAGEMRSRTGDVAGAQVRTLHSLGFDILGQVRGGQRPRVLDERAVRDLLQDLAPVRPRANDDVYAPYLEALAEVRAALRSPEVVEAQRDDVPGFAQLFDAYRERLAEMGAIDFDEQVYGAVEALLRDAALRQSLQRRCAHVLLDELQDVTPAQLLLVRLLSAPAHDVYGVGDDDQVIYGYAGADPRFLVDYDRFFPGAHSYLLEVNYRCPPAVVGAATHLLSYNHLRVPKSIRADHSIDGSAAEGLLVEQHDDAELGSRLVELVGATLANGAQPADVAVLTRVNAGLLAPQVLLAEAGVPVHATVDERMLDRTGSRAVLAWLRLASAVAERQPLDGRDLAVVARRPSRGLSPGLMKALGRGSWPLARLSSFADGLDDTRLREKLTGFHDDLERLGERLRARATTAELLLHVRDGVGLGRALDRLDDARSAPGGGHIDDLDALILVARAQPDPGEFEPWLRQRLRGASRRRGDQPPGRDRDGEGAPALSGAEGPLAGPPPQDDGRVTLSTVHKVKGLEWPYVVVWDASEGVMPHRLSQSGRALEEERRVFHVAITRARRRATVLARSGGKSSFLAELTGEATHRPPPREADVETGKAATGRPSDRRARSAGSATSTATAGDEELDPAATKRAEALREWRRRRASDDKLPAYVILHDRHLDGIARRNPRSLDDLAACDGIGPTKLDRYGDDILAALTELADDGT